MVKTREINTRIWLGMDKTREIKFTRPNIIGMKKVFNHDDDDEIYFK